MPVKQPCDGDPQGRYGRHNTPVGGGGIVAEQGLAHHLEEMEQGIVSGDENPLA